MSIRGAAKVEQAVVKRLSKAELAEKIVAEYGPIRKFMAGGKRVTGDIARDSARLATLPLRGGRAIDEHFGVTAGVAKRMRRIDKTAALALGSAGIGVTAGVLGGFRGTARNINTAAGNPVGFASSLGVRTAFAGNPADSRTKRGGASGNIPLNSR